MEKSTQKKDLTLLHMIIIILLMFGFGYLPTIGAITTVGMKTLGIFIGLLYGWSTIGMLWPSILGIFAFGFSGHGTVKEMLAMAFSNDIFIFLIFILVILEMLTDSGAVNVIVNFFLTRKSLEGHPWIFSFIFLLSSGLLCIFGQAFAGILLCWSMIETLSQKVGYKPYDKYPTMMLIGVIISASAVQLMVPFKGICLVILGTYATMTGNAISYLSYMAVMIPAGLAFLALYLTFFKMIFKPDMKPLETVKVSEILGTTPPVTKRQKATLLAFGFFLATLLIPGCLPATSPIVTLTNTLGSSGLTAFSVILFMMIKIDGEPLLDFSKQARHLNWSVTFMVGVLMMMTSLILAESTGIRETVITLLSPVLAGYSGFVLLVVVFMISIVLTNFMNNMVVGVIMTSILLALSSTLEVNTAVGVLMIITASNAAFLTPAAAPTVAMLFAKKDWLKGKDVFRIGFMNVSIIILIGLTIIVGLGSIILT